MRTASLIAFLIAASVPAYAQPPITVEANAPTATIPAADLNLHSAPGLAKLQIRIRTAAEQLCMEPHNRDLGRVSLSRSCFDHALASAQPQIERLARANLATGLAAATITISAN